MVSGDRLVITCLDESSDEEPVPNLVRPHASGEGQAPVWLPTPGDRGLVLALRVYNPDATLSADPLRLDPPRITRLGDCP